MTTMLATTSATVTAYPVEACPHCRRSFDAVVDATQPLRLQGAKCPHCGLFVPVRLIDTFDASL